MKQELDNCEICKGQKGGEPGNENIITIDNKPVIMCDYCHAEYLSQQIKDKDKRLIEQITRLKAQEKT
jgi:hypothetical protein